MYPLQVSGAWAIAASNWHSGQGSALYSIASTGAIHSWDIVCEARREILDALNSKSKTSRKEMRELFGAILLLWENDIGAPAE